MTIFKKLETIFEKKKRKTNQLYVYEAFKDYRKYIEKKNILFYLIRSEAIVLMYRHDIQKKIYLQKYKNYTKI